MTNKFNPKIADVMRKLIGNFVRERRNEQGLTLEQLAKQAGIRKQTLIDLELGRNYEINTLAAIIGCLRGELQIVWKDPETMPGFDKPVGN